MKTYINLSMKKFLTKKPQLGWGVPPKRAILFWKTPTTRKARMTPLSYALLCRAITKHKKHTQNPAGWCCASLIAQHSNTCIPPAPRHSRHKKSPDKGINSIKYRFQFVRRAQIQTFANKYIIANLKDASRELINKHLLHSTALNLY
jgi:hypothetical protein